MKEPAGGFMRTHAVRRDLKTPMAHVILGDGPAAWALLTWINADGYEAEPQTQDALAIVTISVNLEFPPDTASRLALVAHVAGEFGAKVDGFESLWVLPGGYFGWGVHALSGATMKDLDSRMLNLLERSFPKRATIVAGADVGQAREDEGVRAWRLPSGVVLAVARTRTPLDDRKLRFLGGDLIGAFFTCGEFAGSPTRANGPFCGGQLLSNVSRQLPDCRLLIDLAHKNVSGTLAPLGKPSPRWVHQRQMIEFSRVGTAVLAHHHLGETTAGRPKFTSQSDWVVHRGGTWTAVPPVPIQLPR